MAPGLNVTGRRATLSALAGVLTAVFALSACGANSAQGDADEVLIIGIESEADVLDPQVAGGWVTWRINSQMYEPLVTHDLRTPSEEAPVPELKPGLAESWEVSEDGKEYTFNIRQGVTFHDGTDLNAEAVEYNIRRMWDEDSPQYSAAAAGQTNFVWQFVEDVTATDEYTVVVRMSQPFSPFLRMLAQGGNGSTGIISPAALEEHGEDIAEHPAGTGPFRFDDRVRGERISLVRNNDYWGEAPALDGVIFRPIPDPAGRTSALRNGEVDVIAVPSPDSVQALVDEGYQLSDGQPPHVWYLSFNMRDEYMSIPEVRQAINLAIDREGISDNLLQGTTEPAYDIQAPANDAYVERADAYGRDLDRARELLAEAGFEDGFTTSLMTSVDGSGQIVPAPMAEFIQQNLAEIGITVEIETMEWISYLGRWAEGAGDVGMMQMSWGMDTPYWLYIVTSSDMIAPSGPNVGYYSNPELDEVMDKAITAATEDEATEYWQRANEIATDDAALAPIVNDRAPYILAPGVEGWVSASQEWYDLTGVTVNPEG
ncbi:ABC transporter substrate-binding protein [Sediminivirga luteola]|uniref:Peptide ABC transporter substrate-binding protein n=1 Tax=Sediminivirga luteola TaxID=1774748 RepID=A0A8J2XJ21_9MICO|nr:ABC transporter substrate-binding protein [Sediminivirga luteola]GGA05114.1 peptide ABC transporter substrate-binding protein [Sediminivirga luteola]